MSNIPVIFGAAFALIGLAAMPGMAEAQATGPSEVATLAAKGEHILSEKCQRCHAIGRTGDSPLAAAPPFRTLASRYPLEQLSEALAEGITTGHEAMPEFIFSTDEIAAILAHLENISEPTPAK